MARGCPTCPNSGISQMQTAGIQMTDAEMVLVEYIGTETKRYFLGISSRQRYPFGTCIGCRERYVLREDLATFMADRARFVVHLDNTSTEQLQSNPSIVDGDGAVPSTSESTEEVGSGV